MRSTDLIDRGYGQGGVDFLQTDEMWDGDIITNPPYKYAKEFVEHAMNVIPDGRKVFMFLKLQFLEGKARGELFKKYPPKCVYVSRVPFVGFEIDEEMYKLSSERLEREKAQLSLFDLGMERNRYE